MNPKTQKHNNARRLLDSGRTREALALLSQTIKESPKDAEAVYLTGVCHARSGDYATAEKHFRKAINFDKRLFLAHSDLGLSLVRQKKFSQAIKSFKQSLEKNPRFAPAHSHLALAYLQTQQAVKALKHANEAVAIDSNHPGFLNTQGLCYRSLGQIQKAIETFERTYTAHPTFQNTLNNLYETYRLEGDDSNAEKALLRAKEAYNTQASIYLTLGKFYEQTERILEAKEQYEQGISKCADTIDLLIALGRANRSLGNIGEGLAQVNKALDLNDSYPPAIAERCAFHMLQGEYDDAYSLLHNYMSDNSDKALTQGLATAYAHACRMLGKYDESIKVLRSTLQDPGVNDDMLSAIHFSLGDSYDKLEKYEPAFTAYRKANNISSQKTDIDRHIATMQAIGRSITSEEVAETAVSENSSKKPVFIVGMPRSGTTLAEQILASHPQVYGAGEITELWAIGQDISDSRNLEHYCEKLAALEKENINRYAARYLEFVEKLDASASRITDKLPHNFLHIGLIKRLFPDAHVIHCHRHPFDTCLSIYFKQFNSNHVYAQNLSEIARFYKEYQALMALWRDTPTRIFSLKYEDIVQDQETLSREMVDHIGLEWNDDCLRYHETGRLVLTPSYSQVNKPIYTSAVNRWKHYRSHLQPLIDVLGDPEQYGQ